MPTIKPKTDPISLKPVKKAKAAPKVETRKVVFETIEVSHKWEGSPDGPITVEQAKKILGWESEADYKARVGDKADKWPEVGGAILDSSGKQIATVLLEDEEGQKVVCWNNTHNRPFHSKHAHALAQDILKRNWAGPTAMPGETINGETMIVSKYGEVLNGNHRLIGLILAAQIWASKRQGAYWRHYWKTEPVIESLVVYGVSEGPKVLRTIDDTRPRTAGDVFFTSSIFAHLDGKAKAECSRMLDRSLHLLWQRTGAGTGSYTKSLTNSEACEFQERHPKLVECVKMMFEANSERALSKVRLSPGECAAMQYLMGASKTNLDEYLRDPPREANIDWANWDKAAKFWSELVKGDKGKLKRLVKAIADLKDQDMLRSREKMALVSKAWVCWVAGDELAASDLSLHYDEEGALDKADLADFGGIDNVEQDDDDPAEVETAKNGATPKKAQDRAAKSAEAIRRAEGEIPAAEPRKTDKEGKPLPLKALKQPLNVGNGLPAPAKPAGKIAPKIAPKQASK